MRLLGRRAECEALDKVLADALAGRSRVAVLRGEAGAGKSALLDYVSERVAGWHVATAVGVESEMELAYSGLHQLCSPMLDRPRPAARPAARRAATVFGRDTGPAPDRFLVGLATLTLLAEVAEQQPLVCIVDDAQWLDDASAQILGFVARRLLAERIALVCAARTGIGDEVLAGLPELSIDGLGDSDARALLLENVHGPLDAAVCEQIIKESHGNPLALLELPRTWNTAELAGGFGFPGTSPGRQQDRTELRRATPAAPERDAAARPHRGRRASGRSRCCFTVRPRSSASTWPRPAPRWTPGCSRWARRVEFAHPLVRSAAYRSAAADDRHRVHRALAEATDPERDPDRRAWHRARAVAGPDEEVAPSSSARRAARRRAVASPPRPRSCSAPSD